MKIIQICLVAIFVAAAVAQDSAPQGYEHWTASDLSSTAETMKAEAGSSAGHVSAKRLANFSGDTLMLIRREGSGTPEWHETQADIFFVQSGSATLVVGGAMTGDAVTEPHERRGGTISGALKQKLAAGDVVRIPARTPHQVLMEGNQPFVYFVIKVAN